MPNDNRSRRPDWRHLFACSVALAFTWTGSLVAQPAQAQDDNSAQAQEGPLEEVESREPTPTSNAKGKPPTVLKGEVHKIDLALESLREVGLDIKRVREAAGDLYDEVSMQPVSFSRPPNVIGSVVIPAIQISTPAMVKPRPKWITRCVEDMEPTIRLLKQDVDDVQSGEKEIHMPAAIWESLQPQFKEWAEIVTNMDALMTQLKPHTNAPPYDNGTIANFASRIQGSSRKLETTRKKIYKVLQKEARTAKQKEKAKRKEKAKKN